MSSRDHDKKEQTVFLVDDDPVIRESMTLMLEQEGIPVSVFRCAEDFLEMISADWQGCAIVDVLMPGMDGLQLQEVLDRKGVQLPIIFLTGHGNIDMGVKAIKSGAEDFLTKPVTREKLMNCIHAALAKGEQMRIQVEQQNNVKTRLQALTKREREILSLSAKGLTNKEIARRLDVSFRTVEHHKSSILAKTGTNSILELLGKIYEAGLASDLCDSDE